MDVKKEIGGSWLKQDLKDSVLDEETSESSKFHSVEVVYTEVV